MDHFARRSVTAWGDKKGIRCNMMELTTTTTEVDTIYCRPSGRRKIPFLGFLLFESEQESLLR